MSCLELWSGCADLAASVLRQRLDKTQQCSTWHLRPLTQAQLTYAAADAAVLLSIFDALLNAAPLPIWRQHNDIPNEANSSIDRRSAASSGQRALTLSAAANQPTDTSNRTRAAAFAASLPHARSKRTARRLATQAMASASEPMSFALSDQTVALTSSSDDDSLYDDDDGDDFWPLSTRWLDPQEHALNRTADTSWSMSAIRQCFCSITGLEDGRIVEGQMLEVRVDPKAMSASQCLLPVLYVKGSEQVFLSL